MPHSHHAFCKPALLTLAAVRLENNQTDAAEAALSRLIALKPAPKADHVAPSHCAIELAGTPPAVVNTPPAYSALPDTARA